jgi:hypothetical protein
VANDYPQIVDKSTLTGVFQADQFMGIGVEGQKDAGGTATVGLPIIVKTADEANTFFGPASSLASLVKFILGRGINYVYAVASASAALPLLAARQTAWAALEENENVRIRLSDSLVQADLVALADSCEFAENIQNKQFCFVQLGGVSVKATALTAATAVSSKRGVLTSGGVYDLNGNLLSGPYGAAYAACEVAKNPDIADSLNEMSIPATAGIEKEVATGLPIYRLRSGGGVPINDHQDLLTGGVSPYQQGRDGLAAFTHLRLTYAVDTTFDALTTLLIKDEVFIGIRKRLREEKFLRVGNTVDNRSRAAKVVQMFLQEHDDWVQPVALADGTTGYGVTAVPGVDEKSFTINYFGKVVRGTNVININGTLTIAA